jgi:hypothetical protein
MIATAEAAESGQGYQIRPIFGIPLVPETSPFVTTK